MRVENLQADNEIKERGQRVYSPNNKPTPTILGVYSKAESDAKYDLKGTAYTKAQSDGRYLNKNAESANQVALFNLAKKAFKTIGPTQGSRPKPGGGTEYPQYTYKLFQSNGGHRIDEDFEVWFHSDVNYVTGSQVVRIKVYQFSGDSPSEIKVAVTHVSGWRDNARIYVDRATGGVYISARRQWGNIYARRICGQNLSSATAFSWGSTHSILPEDRPKDMIEILPNVGTVVYDAEANSTYYADGVLNKVQIKDVLLNKNGDEYYSSSHKPTWTDVGGEGYFTKDDTSKYIHSKDQYWNMCADTRGWMPHVGATGSAATDFLGNSGWWFKEAWVNTYRGSSIDVNGKGIFKGGVVVGPNTDVGAINIDFQGNPTQHGYFRATHIDAAASGGNYSFHFGSTEPITNVIVDDGGFFEGTQRVYSPNNKPKWADIQSKPSNYNTTWGQVSGKPVQATRWPTWNEVTGKPTDFTPKSHTHTWAQVTGKPNQATRWPSWTEVTGKPSGLLSQATADGRYLGKSATATKANRLGDTNLNTTATIFLSVPNNNWWGDKSIGHSQMIRSNSVGAPSITDGGYAFRFGARDVSKGHAWFCTSSYQDGGALYYGINDSGSQAPVWEKIYSTGHKPTAADVGALTKSQGDSYYLGKTAKAHDSDLLDNIDSKGFCRAYGHYTHIGGTSGDWTTAQFIAWLKTKGAFNQPYWMCKGSWAYANNKTISDTGVGRIHLAGAVIEVMGSESSLTIRVTTPNAATSSGITRAQFTYNNQGGQYAPGWHRDYNTSNKPTAADVGALTKSQGDGYYLGKTATASNANKLGNISKSTSPTANTIAQRDGSGDIQCRLVRNNYGDETNMSGGLAFRINNGTNNFLRICKNPTAILEWLGLRTRTVPNGTNLNTLETTSTWIIYDGKNKYSNCPISYGTLEVIGDGRRGNTFVTQRITEKSTNRVMTRSRNDGSMYWGPWVSSYISSGTGAPSGGYSGDIYIEF